MGNAAKAPQPGLSQAGARSSRYYNRCYKRHTKYHLPWQQSPYLRLWKHVLRILVTEDAKSVLDIGCGPGQFAAFIRDRAPQISYRGFDFSGTAVDLAARRGLADLVSLGDLRTPEAYEGEYEAATAVEVLEHLDDDRAVFGRLPPGTLFVFTVPSYDSHAHVRFFPSIESVVSRYDGLLDDLVVQRLRIVRGRFFWIGFGRVPKP